MTGAGPRLSGLSLVETKIAWAASLFHLWPGLKFLPAFLADESQDNANHPPAPILMAQVPMADIALEHKVTPTTHRLAPREPQR